MKLFSLCTRLKKIFQRGSLFSTFAIVLFWFLFAVIFYKVGKISPFSASSIFCIVPDLSLLFSFFLLISIAVTYLIGGHRQIPVLSISLFVCSTLIVLLFYFYKHPGEEMWGLSTHLTYMEVVIALFSALVVVWGGYLAIKQLKETADANKITANTNKLAAFKMMIDILQDEKMRSERMLIYPLLQKGKVKLMKDWNKKERVAAHNVLTCLDQVGLMVKYGLLDYSFLEGWYYSTYKLLYILKELKEKEEKEFSHKLKCIDNVDCKSDYYLGVAELLRLRNKNVEYDFENDDL